MGAIVEKYLFQVVAGVVGVSLSLNSFLVKDKVQEISSNIASMAASIRGLEISTAVVKQQLDFQAKEIDQLRQEIDQLKKGRFAPPH